MPDAATGNGVRTVIESLGVYLPSREVTTDEIVRGCRTRMRFPLERMTGIKSRRVVGENEFAIDLAREAVAKCLAASHFGPADIDLVVSAGIARADGPGFQVSYEPSTATRLKKLFGFERAIAYDVRSACSGMWIGLAIADALIRQGTIARALVVSGEYISHLTATAQIEIEGFLDNRMACLTLGDAGAAVLLAGTSDSAVGFAALELGTLGGFAEYCVAGPTAQAHGGAIMVTDALKLTDAAARHGSEHALETLQRAGWQHGDFDFLIMHQTSRTAITGAVRAINRLVGGQVCHEQNTINNLERRGNTATTTHFVALADQIESGRIRSGDRIIFSISGSGLTFGTALYTLDTLPERLQRPGTSGTRPVTVPVVHEHAPARIRIAAIGRTARARRAQDTLGLLTQAALACLKRAVIEPSDVGLIMFAGIYRTDFVNEPAMAAFLAGRLGANATAASNGRRTLAFDVLNGGVGILNACWTAQALIRAGRTQHALIVAAEAENNAAAFPGSLLGVEESGSALLVTAATAGDPGFGRFHFASYPEHSEVFVSHLTNRDGKAYLRFTRAPALEDLFIEAIASTIAVFLANERCALDDFACILAPQISTAFLDRLACVLGAARERLVDVTLPGLDLSTSSLPYALEHAREHGMVRAGDAGLIVCVGAGIEVACATYHF